MNDQRKTLGGRDQGPVSHSRRRGQQQQVSTEPRGGSTARSGSPPSAQAVVDQTWAAGPPSSFRADGRPFEYRTQGGTHDFKREGEYRWRIRVRRVDARPRARGAVTARPRRSLATWHRAHPLWEHRRGSRRFAWLNSEPGGRGGTLATCPSVVA